MCKFNRILLGTGALLFFAVMLSISNFTFIFYDNINTTLSTCDHLYEVIITNLVILISSIIPLSIIFTPCEFSLKQQLFICLPVASIMSIFAIWQFIIIESKICQDQYTYTFWILSSGINFTVPCCLIFNLLLFIIIHSIKKHCDCTRCCNNESRYADAVQCWEDYRRCCFKVQNKSEKTIEMKSVTVDV